MFRLKIILQKFESDGGRPDVFGTSYPRCLWVRCLFFLFRFRVCPISASDRRFLLFISRIHVADLLPNLPVQGQRPGHLLQSPCLLQELHGRLAAEESAVPGLQSPSHGRLVMGKRFDDWLLRESILAADGLGICLCDRSFHLSDLIAPSSCFSPFLSFLLPSLFILLFPLSH